MMTRPTNIHGHCLMRILFGLCSLTTYEEKKSTKKYCLKVNCIQTILFFCPIQNYTVRKVHCFETQPSFVSGNGLHNLYMAWVAHGSINGKLWHFAWCILKQCWTWLNKKNTLAANTHTLNDYSIAHKLQWIFEITQCSLCIQSAGFDWAHFTHLLRASISSN